MEALADAQTYTLVIAARELEREAFLIDTVIIPHAKDEDIRNVTEWCHARSYNVMVVRRGLDESMLTEVLESVDDGACNVSYATLRATIIEGLAALLGGESTQPPV